jgi:hypothetical protein
MYSLEFVTAKLEVVEAVFGLSGKLVEKLLMALHHQQDTTQLMLEVPRKFEINYYSVIRCEFDGTKFVASLTPETPPHYRVSMVLGADASQQLRTTLLQLVLHSGEDHLVSYRDQKRKAGELLAKILLKQEGPQ